MEKNKHIDPVWYMYSVFGLIVISLLVFIFFVDTNYSSNKITKKSQESTIDNIFKNSGVNVIEYKLITLSDTPKEYQYKIPGAKPVWDDGKEGKPLFYIQLSPNGKKILSTEFNDWNNSQQTLWVSKSQNNNQTIAFGYYIKTK
jgi:hypothetical protein